MLSVVIGALVVNRDIEGLRGLRRLAVVADSNVLSGARHVAALERVPDPREGQGVRHRITAILAVATCAALAGCRSFTAIGEWADNVSVEVLAALEARLG